MNLVEYTKLAQRTAMSRAYDYRYLVPGLLSEVGEAYGVEAKAHRYRLSDEDYYRRMVGEWGDIAWVVSLLIYRVEGSLRGRGVVLGTPFLPETPTDRRPLPLILGAASSIAALIEADDVVSDEDLVSVRLCAYRIWYLLELHAERVTGRTFTEVLEANLEKLGSRKRRNVLGGSGDFR